MKARIVKIDKDSVVIKNGKNKFVDVPKKKLEFDYKLGDTIEIEKNGSTFYFLPAENDTKGNDLEAFWDDGEENDAPIKNNEKKTEKIKGIGGWLLFYIVCLCLSLILSLTKRNTGISKSDCATLNSAFNGYCDGITPLITIENTMILIMFVAQIVAIILILSKKKAAINYNVVFLIASTIWVLIDTIWAIAITKQYHLPSSSMSPVLNQALATAFGCVVSCLIWVPYFLKSERVKNTLTK